MKISSDPAVDGFKPVSVTFVFESQAELNAFGRMFNTASIMGELDRIAPSLKALKIYEIFRNHGAEIRPTINTDSQ